jgi:hypothetical protein
MTLGMPYSAEMVEELEFDAWLSMFVWLALLPLGVWSGVMIIRQQQRWPLVLLTSIAIYVFCFRPWRWLALHIDLLRGALRVENVPVMWQKPGFMFDTFVFPTFALVAAACSIYAVVRARQRHAI